MEVLFLGKKGLFGGLCVALAGVGVGVLVERNRTKSYELHLEAVGDFFRFMHPNIDAFMRLLTKEEIESCYKAVEILKTVSKYEVENEEEAFEFTTGDRSELHYNDRTITFSEYRHSVEVIESFENRLEAHAMLHHYPVREDDSDVFEDEDDFVYEMDDTVDMDFGETELYEPTEGVTYITEEEVMEDTSTIAEVTEEVDVTEDVVKVENSEVHEEPILNEEVAEEIVTTEEVTEDAEDSEMQEDVIEKEEVVEEQVVQEVKEDVRENTEANQKPQNTQNNSRKPRKPRNRRKHR